ncbi:hypothetical protein TorRG33x02_229050, partial [Trema orientale]
MASKLDRYTTSYLLSGYALNDFKLKSNVDSHFIANLEEESLSPNPRLVSDMDGLQSPSHLASSRQEGIGAHGLDRKLMGQLHGAHGMEKEAAMVLDNQDQGAQAAARVSLGGDAPVSGLGLGLRGATATSPHGGAA